MIASIFWAYVALGVALGGGSAIVIRFQRWMTDTGRSVEFNPNKDSLGYLICLIVAVPVVNVLCVLYLMWCNRQKAKAQRAFNERIMAEQARRGEKK